MIFDILGVMPKLGNQWKIGKETVGEFIERGDLFVQEGKAYRKIRPYDETQDNIKPFWALFNANQYGTAESAKAELSNILGTKEHEFETVKPIQMIKGSRNKLTSFFVRPMLKFDENFSCAVVFLPISVLG